MKSFKLQDKPIQPMTKNQLKFWLGVEVVLAVFFAWEAGNDIANKSDWWLILFDLALVAVAIIVGFDFYKKLKGGVYRHDKSSN